MPSISYGNCCLWFLHWRPHPPYYAQPSIPWIYGFSRGHARQCWTQLWPHDHCSVTYATLSPSQEVGQVVFSAVKFLQKIPLMYAEFLGKNLLWGTKFNNNCLNISQSIHCVCWTCFPVFLPPARYHIARCQFESCIFHSNAFPLSTVPS